VGFRHSDISLIQTFHLFSPWILRCSDTNFLLYFNEAPWVRTLITQFLKKGHIAWKTYFDTYRKSAS